MEEKSVCESVVEEFIHYLEDLYWEGYAKQLATDNPGEYMQLYNEFLDNYGLPY